MAIPNVSTLYQRINKGSEGGLEFARLMNYLLTISSILTDNANILLAGCNIAMSPDLEKTLGGIFLEGTSRNLYANYATTNVLMHVDTDQSGNATMRAPSFLIKMAPGLFVL